MKSMKKKKRILLVLFGVILLLAIVFIVFNSSPPARIGTLQNSIRTQGNMVLVEQEYQVAFAMYNETLGGLINSNRLLFTVNYRLRAGIDFTDFAIERDGNIVTVHYSPPVIFSTDPRLDTLTEILARVRGVFSRIDQSHYLDDIHNRTEEINQTALKNGLNATVTRNAELFFTAQLMGLGIDAENIRFKVGGRP